jgi:hypothetical protein
VTLASVVADALLSDKLTVAPPAGAWPVNVTVPVDELPPVTAVGFIVTVVRAAGVTVRVAVCVPLNVPVMIAEAELATPVVVIVKVAVVAPAVTVTLAGTVAAALLLDNATDAPPAGAALLRVTVPVEELPPTTLVGFTVRLEIVAGLIVSVAVLEPL